MAKKTTSAKRQRLHRPDPVRSAPNRSGMDHLRRNAESAGAFRNAGTAGGKSPVSDAVQQGMTDVVNLGYSVIEQQIREGQLAAERLREGITNSTQLNSDVAKLVEGLVATTRDIGATWLDLLAIVVRSIAPQPPRPGPPPGPGSGLTTATKSGTSGRAVTVSSITPADPASPRIPPSIIVKSGRVTSVTLDLRPASMRFAPFVRSLPATNPKLGALTGVKFNLSADATESVLTVDVPHKQPAGIYTGTVVDSSTNEFGGTVSVTVGN